MTIGELKEVLRSIENCHDNLPVKFTDYDVYRAVSKAILYTTNNSEPQHKDNDGLFLHGD